MADKHEPTHVVVDGSNLATEGRSMPSLAQLEEAVASYMEEHPDAQVTVAELLPAVVEWNRNPDYRLAAGELEDPRVELVVGDVADVIRERPRGFDAILLDVDNGASELTTVSNKELYQAESLQRARAGLRAGGCLAVWSADKDPAFVERMEQVGVSVTTERVPAYPGGKVYNWLFAGIA